MIDLTLDSLTVPGIPDYTPPFGTQKDPLVSLSTVETNNNIIKPFTAQRAIEFSHDETLSRIERNACLVFTGDADAVLDMSDVTTFKGNEIKIVNTTNHALTVKYLEVGEASYSTMNLTENSATLTADSTTTYSVKVSVESESITTLWSGTKEQFDAIPVKDSNTLYNIIDDVDEELIQDDEVSPNSTWSSEKIVGLNDCLARAKNTCFWNYGATVGLPSGLIRSGYIPKKVVFLGNSLTVHRPVEEGAPEGYVWTVYDWRAMCATTPTSDWTSLVYKKLHEINPDISVKKAAIINWEAQTAGSRNLSAILDNKSCAELKEDGGHYLENTTIKDILTDDVDVIVWQGFENVASPTSDPESWQNIYNDYTKVFDDLRALCPKATLSAIPGFWRRFDLSKIVQTACIRKDVNIVPIWNVMSPASDRTDIQAQEGYEIHDAKGNVICITDSVVAGHPNDKGHILIAFYVLMNLFKGHSPDSMEYILPIADNAPIDASILDKKSLNDDDTGGGYLPISTLNYDIDAIGDACSNILFNSCVRLLGTFSNTDSLSHALLSTRVTVNSKHGAIPACQEIRSIGEPNFLIRTSNRNLIYAQSWNKFVALSLKGDNVILESSVDWNTLMSDGKYFLNGGVEMTNAPSNKPFGSLEVFFIVGNCVVQRYFDFSGKLYLRRHTGAWQSWYEFAGTEI